MQPEAIIISSTDDTLRLTNHRVVHEVGGEAYASIPLHHVAACAFTVKTYPLLAILGGFSLLIGVVSLVAKQSDQGGMVGVVIGLALLAMWWLFRPGVLVIQSSGGHKISVPTKRLGYHDVKRFAEAVAAELMKRT